MCWSSSGEEQVDLLKAEQTGVPDRNYVIEPMGRGTAPAIALSAITLRKRDPLAIMAVLTADHFIGDDEGFREVLAAAGETAARDYLVTLGITPSSPSTGYGYVERGPLLMNADGFAAYRVVAFREKPDLVTAKRFVVSGKHSWNSGMFVWKVERFLDGAGAHDAGVLSAIDVDRSGARYARLRPRAARGVAAGDDADRRLWRDGKGARRGRDSGRVWLERCRFVGDAAGNSGERRAGNVVRHAQHIGVDTQNTLVFGHDRVVATIGLHDMIVIDTGDAVLVCPKDRAQDVKKIVDELKQAGEATILVM